LICRARLHGPVFFPDFPDQVFDFPVQVGGGGGRKGDGGRIDASVPGGFFYGRYQIE
jgi:hypothetical protein